MAMSQALKMLLEDKKAYPDNSRIALGEGREMTVGEFRQFYADEQAALAKRSQELNERTAAVEKAQQEATNLYASVVALQDQGGQPRQAAPANNNPGGQPAPDDPYAQFYEEGPIGAFARFARQREGQAAQAWGMLYKMLQDTQTMLHRQRYQFDYDYVIPELRDEKGNAPTVQELIKIAAEEKLLDEYNTPSIRKAAAKIKSERSHQKELERVRQEALEEGKKQAQATLPQAPSGGGVQDRPLFRTVEPATLDRRDPLGGAIKDALNDGEMWKNVNVAMSNIQ